MTMLIWKKRSRKGIALIVVLLALIVLAAVGGGVVAVSTDTLMHAHTGNESLEALYAARAGAWHKLGQIRAGDDSSITTPIVLPKTKSSYTVEVKKPSGGPKSFPPPNTIYVEATGKSFSGKVRKVGMLAEMSQSRWNHAAFGNNQVVMKSGSYTDSFNSDGGAVDHSKASIATNNAIDGIVIEDHKAVVIGWSQSDDGTGKKKKKKEKDGSKTKLVAQANAQGPPGSTENVVVAGGKGADQAYNSFVTGASKANNKPVVVPALTPVNDLTLGAVSPVDPTLIDVDFATGTKVLPPGAYQDLKVGTGGVAVLDLTSVTTTKAQFSFHAIELNGGTLQVIQKTPPIPVEIYVDTGDGTDNTAGVRMTGSSVINPVQKPINLQLLIAGKGTNNFLEGYDDVKDSAPSPTAYYVAYAPRAEITVSRGQIYGSVVAKKVTLDGESLTDPSKAPAVIHFDQTLLDDTSNPPQIEVLSVRNF